MHSVTSEQRALYNGIHNAGEQQLPVSTKDQQQQQQHAAAECLHKVDRAAARLYNSPGVWGRPDDKVR